MISKVLGHVCPDKAGPDSHSGSKLITSSRRRAQSQLKKSGQDLCASGLYDTRSDSEDDIMQDFSAVWAPTK